MIILVERSSRPRRWAGVALFAGTLTLLWWLQRHDSVGALTAVETLDGPEAGVGLLLDDDHNAQATTFAPSNATSTLGEMPTR